MSSSFKGSLQKVDETKTDKMAYVSQCSHSWARLVANTLQRKGINILLGTILLSFLLPGSFSNVRHRHGPHSRHHAMPSSVSSQQVPESDEFQSAEERANNSASLRLLQIKNAILNSEDTRHFNEACNDSLIAAKRQQAMRNGKITEMLAQVEHNNNVQGDAPEDYTYEDDDPRSQVKRVWAFPEPGPDFAQQHDAVYRFKINPAQVPHEDVIQAKLELRLQVSPDIQPLENTNTVFLRIFGVSEGGIINQSPYKHSKKKLTLTSRRHHTETFEIDITSHVRNWLKGDAPPLIFVDADDGRGVNLGSRNTNLLSMHLTLSLGHERARRQRRNSQCSSSYTDINRCCRHRLVVDFQKFGWGEWIIAPKSYIANYCTGVCAKLHDQPYYNTHLVTSINGLKPCCSPTKLSALSILYFDVDGNVVLTNMPNMVVEKCQCL